MSHLMWSCLLACLTASIGAQQTVEPVAETRAVRIVRHHSPVLRHVGVSRQRYEVPTAAAVPASTRAARSERRASSQRQLRLRR